MALAQLGFMEDIYGSPTYAYLSVSMVFITMLICVAINGILIYHYNRADLMQQQAVGYSCVLFAWMVALSVRLKVSKSILDPSIMHFAESKISLLHEIVEPGVLPDISLSKHLHGYLVLSWLSDQSGPLRSVSVYVDDYAKSFVYWPFEWNCYWLSTRLESIEYFYPAVHISFVRSFGLIQ